MRLDYCTYAWLREDRTPYYIGKGTKRRAFRKGSPPPHRVLILKTKLSETEAFRHERYMISVFGRKDLGTGHLINLTEGGEGTSGRIWSKEERKKHMKYLLNQSETTRSLISQASRQRLLGSKLPNSTKEKMRGPRETSRDIYILSSPFGEDYAFKGREWLAAFLGIAPTNVSRALSVGGWKNTKRGKSKWSGWDLIKIPNGGKSCV